MEETEKDIQPTEINGNEENQPHLSASFFSRLVQQPSCVTMGICDGCGRCEH